MTTQHIAGLDLGQQADPTALVILERQEPAAGLPALYECRHIERWPLGTPYPQIVSDVLARLQSPLLVGPALCVDQTGVGAAVVDMLRLAVQCAFFPVVITSGLSPNRDERGGVWKVPKKDLVASLQVLLGHRRLRIAGGLPAADVLVKELQNFRAKVTASGNEVLEAWREGMHDDIVLALAIACWVGEHVCSGGPVDMPPSGARTITSRPPEGVFHTTDEEERRGAEEEEGEGAG